MSAELGLIAVDTGSTIKPINSTPRVKKTVNGKLTDANLEFYNLVSGELVSTTSSDDFSISEDNITINTNTPLFMWVPPVISKNVGESYSRTTYQLQFKPKLRTFNSSLTTVNKWYFEDNTLPTYLLGKINKDSRFYDTALNYTIGLIQPNSDELLEYNLNSIGSEFSNNNTIIGSIDTSTLPAALTNFSIVKAAINMENGTINNIFIIGGKDTSGSPVDTIYVSTLSNAGSSLESKYKSNGYSFTNQDNFESVMEINGGTSPTFTLKYSNPDAINVNNLQEIADPLSTTSSTPGPGIKIYSYLTNLIPGMTINSINAKISSSKIPPHLSLNRAVS